MFYIFQHLTYKITRYTSDLTKKQVDRTIRSSLKMWAKVTPLTFSKVSSGLADIEIVFEKSVGASKRACVFIELSLVCRFFKSSDALIG